jgi:hypothetical protein
MGHFCPLPVVCGFFAAACGRTKSASLQQWQKMVGRSNLIAARIRLCRAVYTL